MCWYIKVSARFEVEIPEIELSEALYVGLVFEPLIWPGDSG